MTSSFVETAIDAHIATNDNNNADHEMESLISTSATTATEDQQVTSDSDVTPSWGFAKVRTREEGRKEGRRSLPT